MLAVRLAQIRFEALLREVLARQRDGRRARFDAADDGAALREPHQVGAGAAADVEHRVPR